MRTNKISGLVKVAIGWLAVFAVRLIPFRLPNVEGIMATLMPVSKRFGALTSFGYGFLAIALYDVVTGKVGSWTLVGALTYGFIGVGAAWFFKNRAAKVANFVSFSIVATLVFDAVTGVLMAPLFGMSFSVAFAGQIPFTAYHLIGNVLFSVILSPAFYRWVVMNPKLEFSREALPAGV